MRLQVAHVCTLARTSRSITLIVSTRICRLSFRARCLRSSCICTNTRHTHNMKPIVARRVVAARLNHKYTERAQNNTTLRHATSTTSTATSNKCYKRTYLYRTVRMGRTASNTTRSSNTYTTTNCSVACTTTSTKAPLRTVHTVIAQAHYKSINISQSPIIR